MSGEVSNSVPVFIEQGVAILTSTSKAILQDQNHNVSNDPILEQFGHDRINEIITPELLRRIKLGQCSESDLEKVRK